MKDKNKGLIIGIIISIFLMFIFLCAPLLLLLFISIFFSVIFYFFILEKRKRKRAKWYILTFIMIASTIFTTIFSTNLIRYNHKGNIYYEKSSRFNEASLYSFNWDKDKIIFPSESELFRVSIYDFEGYTLFNINLTLFCKIEDIKKVMVNMSYYYDGEIDNIKIISNNIKKFEFNLKEREYVLGSITINFTAKQYDHYKINYLFIIYVILANKNINELRAIITFGCNKDDEKIKYDYFVPSGYARNYEGQAYFDSNYMNILIGKGILPVAAFILLFSYLFILGLSFIWQRFDLANFMIIIYVVMGIILLFWYITWALDGNASRLGLPEVFDQEWKVKGIVVEYLNLESLRMIIILYVAIVQWCFTILMVLSLMTIVTYAFDKVFAIDKISSTIYDKKLLLGG
ncbi:MAG: hypothetical protein ACP6IY_21720 [Promethearchaeia archaeon]